MADEHVGETARVEYKERFDTTSREGELKLIREIVAFANSGGGSIVIGQRDDGVVVGLDEAVIKWFDPANVCGKVEPFVAPEAIEVTVRVTTADGSTRTVWLDVPAHRMPPLVIAKDGTCGSGTEQKTLFRRGDVLVRKGTRVQPAARMDYLRWIDDRVTTARMELLNNLNFVASLPPGSVVSSTAGDEEIDEPNALLRRAGRTWKHNNEKLLTSTELVSLLLSTRPLDMTDPAGKALVHSALRKRTTLWHWIAQIDRSTKWIFETILEAIAGTDRDKSDAGRAIIEVAAVFLGDDDYEYVREQLDRSTYKHFREAAEDADRATVLGRLRQMREESPGGRPLREWSIEDLRDETHRCATVLLGAGQHKAESRLLGRIGLELFARSERGAVLRSASADA